MIKKSLFIPIAFFALLIFSCNKYDNEIADIQNRLDKIEGTVIAGFEAQISGINSSITYLENADVILSDAIFKLGVTVGDLEDELKANTDADAQTKKKLQEEIAEINKLILALQNEDTALDQKIEDLKAYIDNELEATQDWADKTFATLEQYSAMQTEIAAIKELLETYRTDITEACTKALEDAIAKGEDSMKGWVNRTLAEGYYDIAEIDAKLKVLETKLSNADADLKEDIKDQQSALEQIKKDLEEAYKDAINKAIEENNGLIDKAIASAVGNALKKVDIKLAVIDNNIAAIQKDIENIKSSIASIEEQIAGINSSITYLNNVDAVLSDAIFKLGINVGDLEDELKANTDADAQTKKKLQEKIAEINKLILALQNEDTALDQKIEDLKAYIDNELEATQDWADKTFATLEQYSAMQTEIAAIKELLETYRTDITEACTKTLEDAIELSEDSMKKWVNQTLAEGYYDIAEIDAKLKALETKLSNADADLDKAIKGQKAALEQAKEDLTKAYQDAIKKAIAENNGIINKAIEDALAAALVIVDGKLTAIGNTIETLQKDLKDLKENFARRIQSLTFLPQYSDGKVKMDYTTKSAEIDLLVSPRELVQFINESHLSAYVRLTENPQTRAVANECKIGVTIVEKADDGVITLNVKDSDNSLATLFWEGTMGAVLYVQINDGNNQIISQTITLVAHSYVSEDNDINGFEGGENFNGNVTE